MLAKQLHSGQKDKGGNDYFTSHLLQVGKSGLDWKEKVVGFLHDAAEDTDIDVPTIIARLKEQENIWLNNPEDRSWVDEWMDIIDDYPEIIHTLTDDEWNEIATALNLLNHHLSPTREEYIAKIKTNRLAVRVKMHDLENNMDISRIPNPTDKDFARLERYKKEYQELAEVNYPDL
ncbi:MAG: phosphohydrolase [Bacteroidales bacterium]|nr:phosphohydrolase [Bacteroidales bacterium]